MEPGPGTLHHFLDPRGLFHMGQIGLSDPDVVQDSGNQSDDVSSYGGCVQGGCYISLFITLLLFVVCVSSCPLCTCRNKTLYHGHNIESKTPFLLFLLSTSFVLLYRAVYYSEKSYLTIKKSYEGKITREKMESYGGKKNNVKINASCQWADLHQTKYESVKTFHLVWTCSGEQNESVKKMT